MLVHLFLTNSIIIEWMQLNIIFLGLYQLFPTTLSRFNTHSVFSITDILQSHCTSSLVDKTTTI